MISSLCDVTSVNQEHDAWNDFCQIAWVSIMNTYMQSKLTFCHAIVLIRMMEVGTGLIFSQAMCFNQK